MAIDPELLELMPTQVSIEFYTGTDAFGNDTYSGAVLRAARVENDTSSMAVSTVPGGTMQAAIGYSTVIYLDYNEPTVPSKSKVTLPSSRELKVVDEIVEYDEVGPYYQLLRCQNNQEG